jgi:hypothetical protein
LFVRHGGKYCFECKGICEPGGKCLLVIQDVKQSETKWQKTSAKDNR